MERNVQRINGNVERLHHWSPEELQNALGFSVVRLTGAAQDYEKLEAELLSRGITPEMPDIPGLELPGFTLDESGESRTDIF